MRLDITFRLERLICLARNEGADEPYLWTFFLKLDGDTVRPSAADPDRFVGSVRATAPPGSHGNLGVEDVEREQRIAIPPERGVYTTELRPIGIPVLGQTYWVPGRASPWPFSWRRTTRAVGPSSKVIRPWARSSSNGSTRSSTASTCRRCATPPTSGVPDSTARSRRTWRRSYRSGSKRWSPTPKGSRGHRLRPRPAPHHHPPARVLVPVLRRQQTARAGGPQGEPPSPRALPAIRGGAASGRATAQPRRGRRLPVPVPRRPAGRRGQPARARTRAAIPGADA